MDWKGQRQGHKAKALPPYCLLLGPEQSFSPNEYLKFLRTKFQAEGTEIVNRVLKKQQMGLELELNDHGEDKNMILRVKVSWPRKSILGMIRCGALCTGLTSWLAASWVHLSPSEKNNPNGNGLSLASPVQILLVLHKYKQNKTDCPTIVPEGCFASASRSPGLHCGTVTCNQVKMDSIHTTLRFTALALLIFGVSLWVSHVHGLMCCHGQPRSRPGLDDTIILFPKKSPRDYGLPALAHQPGVCRYGTKMACCYGWKRNSKGICEATCEPRCKFGECVGPNKCRCFPGYTGKTCSQDVNECGAKPRPCQHRCVNTHGSYKCFCLSGHMLLPDATCSNSRTCARANCQYSCEETEEGPRCVCPSSGLRLGPNGRVCLDIDECASRKAVCPYNRRCVNTFGSYYCKCHIGFELKYVSRRYDCI
ncbi:epidermal growth factor-like protein 6, partial [Cricetulus griseus]